MAARARSIFGLVLSVSLRVWCSAQTSSSAVPPSSNAPGPVNYASASGHITNSLTGDFVGGAMVRLVSLRKDESDSDGEPHAISGPDGSFQINSISPGEYLIRAEKEGFIRTAFSRHAPFLNVGASEAKTNVDIQLTPQAVVSGRVEDTDGKPVPHVQATAYLIFPERGKISLRKPASADVDEAGRFTLRSLPAGRYYIVVDPSGKQDGGQSKTPKPVTPASAKSLRQPSTSSIGLVRTFFPRSVDLDGAGLVELTAGQTVSDLRVSMRKLKTQFVRGKLSELPPAMPVTNLRIFLKPNSSVDTEMLAQSTSVLPNGAWSLGGVVPGSYTLELTGSITGNGQEGARGHVPLAEQQVDVGANDLPDVALSVNPPVQATGTITIDGPANGSSLSRLRVIARPLSDVTHSNFGFANVANDGTFVLRNLNRERYVINLLTGGTGLYVKSLDLGGQDILYKQTDLSQVSDPQIHAVVRLGAGEISGRVQDPSSTGSGTPIRAAVALVPQTLAPDASNVVFTYARGSGFAFSGIAPGTYLLFAAEFADPNIWQNPDFLQQIGSVGSAVTVTENGHTSTQLDRLSLEQVDSAAQRAGLGSP